MLNHQYETQYFTAINRHLLIQVMWDDVIGEHDGLRSVDCAWDLSQKCYEGTKGGCYLCLALICGPPIAFCAGLHFACLSFQVFDFGVFILLKICNKIFRK